jgi:hypothetical protein
MSQALTHGILSLQQSTSCVQHNVAIEAPNTQSAILLPLAGMGEFTNFCVLQTLQEVPAKEICICGI